MTYSQFIHELRRLVREARALQRVANANDAQFRDWRHRAESTIAAIQAEGFIVPGGFNSRSRRYGPNVALVKPEVAQRIFERDIGDSINELQFIVTHFDNYGVARRSDEKENLVALATTSLASPEKVTLAWLFANVPIVMWFWGAAVVFGAFIAGFVAAQIPAAKSIVCAIRADACEASLSKEEIKAVKPQVGVEWHAGHLLLGNQGTESFVLWGWKSGTKREILGSPIIVPPRSFQVVDDGFDNLDRLARTNNERSYTLDVYLADQNKLQKFTAVFELRILDVPATGVINVDAIQHELRDDGW